MTASGPDPAFAPLLADPRTALRPPGDGTAMAEYRRRLDGPMAAVRGPAVHAVETIAVSGALRVRRYTAVPAPRDTILFLHGGGFVIGSLETHDAMCRSLAVASGADVVAVDYRLAPEAPYPAARDDARTALHWAAERSSGALAICGDSAGGHLATATALYAVAAAIPVAALGLLYPVVDPACTGASWERLATGHVLTRAWMRWAWSAYLASADPAAPDVALLSARLGTLPPTHIVVAEHDPLNDEGEALAARIAAAGGTVTLRRAAGMIHGFASLPMLTPAAADTIDELGAFFRQRMC